jgi:hypothetical protein
MWHGRAAQLAAATALIAMMSGPAGAEVVGSAANGFEVRETVYIAADAAHVYAAVIAPAHWWDSAHTFSKSAANLSLDARAGGCWCETLADGGTVQHLIVVYAAPGKTLRLRGALGPLQSMGADGALTWTIGAAATGTGSDLVLDYAVGGFAKDGLDKLAAPVDGVLKAQAERLKLFIETGAPAPQTH